MVPPTPAARRSAAWEILTRLRRAGFDAFYAGGCVRDMLLGVADEGDIDIATSAAPHQVAQLFRRTVGVGASFGVMIVVRRGIPFEVATFRCDAGSSDGRHPDTICFTDARHDALRRDFTINGLFYDPVAGKVIDYVGGTEDIKRKIIRAIGDPSARFTEDYLRLMRAIRFAARFGFAIEESTWEAIRAHCQGVGRISAERIFQEIDKMLARPGAGEALRLLVRSGLCAVVLPEVAALEGVEQPPEFHPEGDVLSHTVKCLELLERPSPVLAWSALLHDIGKPATLRRQDRIRFNNHHRVGANAARRALRRLKAPNALVEAVYECIDNHMNFINVTQMRLSTLKKFLARPTFKDELELHRIDCLASHGDVSNCEFLAKKAVEFSSERIAPKPLIGGKDLIALGFAPGPRMGQILRRVYDLQLEEALTTPQEARAWVKEHYTPEP